MLMNSHTALRSFHELDYDLKEFLEVFNKELCPLDKATIKDGLVEFCWADGSVDLVPTFRFISGIVQNFFPSITIGDSAELIPSTSEYGRQFYRKQLTLFVKNIGLSARIEQLDMSDKDIEFIGGLIVNLHAKYVELSNTVNISDLEADRLHTEYLSVTERANVGTARVSNQVVVSDRLDISAVHPNSAIGITNTGFSISMIEHLTENNEDIPNICLLSGPMRYAPVSVQSVERVISEKHPVAYVEVPIVTATSSSITYEYSPTYNSTYIPSATGAFDESSDVSISLIYPKKSKLGKLDSGKVGVRLVAPTILENNRIVTVRNTSAGVIHACNVWQFGNDSTRANYGVMVPVHYIDIPAFSSLDFLFTHDIIGSDQLVVYMLPMKNI